MCQKLSCRPVAGSRFDCEEIPSEWALFPGDIRSRYPMISDPTSVRDPTPCAPRPVAEPEVAASEKATSPNDTNVKDKTTPRDSRILLTPIEQPYNGSLRARPTY